MSWLEQIASFRLYSGQRLSLWLWLALGVVALVVVLYWYGATRRVVSDRWRKILTGLRIAALAFLVLYLMNPVLSYRQRKTVKGAVAVAIDTSLSMSIGDSVGGMKRFDAVRQLLTAAPHELLRNLAGKGQVSLYHFDRTAQPLTPDMFRRLSRADGEATDLASVLDRIGRDAVKERFIAAIVFSDGRANVRSDPLTALAGLRIPVHVVGVGQIEDTRTRRADVALIRVDANPIATRDIATVARVRFQQHGFSGGLFPIAMTEGRDKVASKTVAAADVTRQEIELRFTPRTTGVHNYEVAVPEQPNEAIADNNRLRFSVLVNETTFRVLYIEGGLRWEYKFLKRLLEQDPTLEARCMVRTGAEHFVTAGRGAVTLKEGFPANLDELAKFRVLILGDLPRRFWSDAQLDMIEKFVSEREGGVLLLGGLELFCSGAYANTPIGKIAPAELAKSAAEAVVAGKKIALTTKGRRSEILAGLEKNIGRIDMGRHYPLGKVKAASEVLLESPDRRPLLVAQPYGKGRVVALATDGIWQGAFGPRKPGESSAGEQLWRQLIQWIGGIKPTEQDEKAKTLVANTDRTYYDPGRPIVVQARVNRKALPGGKASVEARFFLGGTGILPVKDHGQDAHATLGEMKEVGRIPLRPDEREVEHTGSFQPPRDGQYEIAVSLQAGGKTIEQVTLYATAGHPYRELEETALNESLLRAIATQTGGRYFSMADAGDVADQIEREKTVRENRIEREWFASPTVFALFAALLGTEWYLRRRKSLI
jgi:uncharacterized membrane protein